MPNGRDLSASNLFQSEENWPQVLYSDELSRCLELLSTPTAKEKRLLRLHGPSGTGKSLFGKQLVISLSRKDPSATAVYVDMPAADLEASSIFSNIGSVLDRPREARLSKPHSVPKKVSKSWRSDDKTFAWRGSGYLYRVSRDLIAQIPAAGPFIKAVMPSSNPVELLGNSSSATPFAFLGGVAAKSPVLLVVDNYQNLSPVLRDTIEASFQDAGHNFRLVAIERKEEWQQSGLPHDLEGFLEEELEFLPA